MKKIILLVSCLALSLAAKAADDYRIVPVQVLKPVKQPVVFTGRAPAIYAVLYVVSAEGEPYRYKNDSLSVSKAALGIKAALEESAALADYDIPVYNYYIFCQDSAHCSDIVAPITDNDLLIVVKDVKVLPYQQFEKAYRGYSEYFYANTYAPYGAQFELFDTVTKQYSHRETMADTLVWSNAVSSLNIADAGIPAIDEARQLAAAEIGKLYAQTLQPYWKTVQRFFFVPNNKDMRKAAEYAENSQWENAMKIWEQYAAANNRQIAAQAVFNMALGCEIGGHYELALEWLQLAEKLYPVKEVKGYQAILQRRIAEDKILEKQLQDL